MAATVSELQTTYKKLTSIPETQEERDAILAVCAVVERPLITSVAAKCKCSAGEVSRAWNQKVGLSPYTRKLTKRIIKSLINHANRCIERFNRRGSKQSAA